MFAVCGAAFATWPARLPAVQGRLGLSTSEPATGLFGLAAGSVFALLGAGAVLTDWARSSSWPWWKRSIRSAASAAEAQHVP
ncbi:hypothetical protein AB0L41_18455 [Amycolatopsis mediterranei]|uniref:hypothetical protein n=1 Tax=Amycolatopsis mediterranei TaxID=33910 RepID=UPI00342D8B4C